MDGEIVATPLMNIGQPFGATWTDMPGEPGDWVGLYSVGAPDANPWLWIHGEDDAYTWLLPGVFPAGGYEFRMFDDYSFERIGTSNTVHIQDPSQPFVMVDDAPIETRQVIQDYSNVSWNEGAPNTDATYFDGVSFASGPVSYVTTSAQGPLPYGGSIKLTFELTGGPLKSSTGASDSAGVFLYMQRSGDDWSAQGAFNDFRLWSHKDVWLGGVTSGTFTIEVSLTPEHWSGVLTEESAAGFAATLANPAVVGLTLYNEIGKGKGSAADSDAQIKIIEYKVLAP
jgi:hypothetical protein